jgi:hypothetical protein
MSVQPEASATPFPEQPSGNIPPAVLEVCGEDNVALVEMLSAEMLAWCELSQLSDPFADVTRTTHHSDATVLPDTPFEHSLEEVDRAKRIAYGKLAAQSASILCLMVPTWTLSRPPHSMMIW